MDNYLKYCLRYECKLCPRKRQCDKETMNDKVYCNHCGKIVDRGHDCPYKPKRDIKKRESLQNAFRSKFAWTKKSKEIRQRDNYLCQVCLRNTYNTLRVTSDAVEVHHITPLEESVEKGLDNENLISLCNMHHNMAEDGEIPRHYLEAIAREQERRK